MIRLLSTAYTPSTMPLSTAWASASRRRSVLVRSMRLRRMVSMVRARAPTSAAPPGGIGAGDFSASIPPGGAAEVGALARTMETMRRNLIDLTSTLRRREAEAQAVLSGIVEGVYAVDRNRIIRYLNPQAARLLGVTPEQAVGRFCGDVLQPRNEDGRRPCDFRCPILQARSAGSAKAVEHLGSPPGEPHRRDHQLRPGR